MNPIVTTLLLLAAGSFFVWTMRRRLAPLWHARKDVRWDEIPARTTALVKFGLGQGRFLRRQKGEGGSGIAHILVFAAFMVLALRTITLVVRGYWADFNLPLLGETQPLGILYGVVQQTVLLGALVGVAMFYWYRVLRPKERLTRSSGGWAILATIAGLMITDLMYEGGLFASGRHDWYPHLYASYAVGKFFVAIGLTGDAAIVVSTLGFWLHVIAILAFGNYLPYGKHFHIITGLPTVFFQRLPPVGQLSRLDLENAETFGASKVTDLSWKELLDTYSCTECGRCQTHCPTYVTGKPLSHKEVNRAIRAEVETLGPQMPFMLASFLQRASIAPGDGTPPALPEGAAAPELPELRALVSADGGVIPDETVWACTTCGWCETACPVFIENIPRIVDMRRNKVLMEADFPEEAQRVFDGMESQSNPWGVGSNKRSDWAAGLDVPVAANLAEAGNKFEYLFFVGCAGSFDERQKKVTRDIFKILKEAKIDFAILGTEEGCNGDSARRLGNEYLFQTLAQANIEVFKKYDVTKVITQCPHCFNTIGNEYAQFGVKYEVVHHAQLIDQLIKEKRIKVTGEQDQTVTVHDSCYLARYNGVTEEPRQVLKSVSKLKVLEMPRNREQGFCCGAGGGRMWLEEKIGSRVNQNRVDEAAGTGASVIATSCPFCLTMMKDGIAETGRDDKMVAKDIAEIVAASMEQTQSPAVPAARPAAAEAEG